MPGRVSNSFAEAVLILTRGEEPGRAAAGDAAIDCISFA